MEPEVLPTHYEVILKSACVSGEWDALCDQSLDAWYWHRSKWMEYSALLGPARESRDISFVLKGSGQVIAGCPLFLEKCAGGGVAFTYAGGYLPGPFFKNGIGKKERKKIERAVFTEVDRLAHEYGVSHTLMTRPALCGAMDGASINPFLRHRMQDVSYLTSVVNLKQSTSDLWHAISKGHRSCIKQMEKKYQALIYDHRNITRAVFDSYRETHRLDAGRVTRSLRTFELMLEGIQDGHSILVEIQDGGRGIAYSLFHRYKGKTFYSSSCRHPDFADLPLHHLSVWKAMEYGLAQGDEALELTFIGFGTEIAHPLSQKEIQIGAFKRGFGGALAQVFCGERYYSRAGAERTWTERVSQWLDAEFAGESEA